jgi:hypothetical protein
MCRCRDKGSRVCRGQRSEWTEGARSIMAANTKGYRRQIRTLIATVPIEDLDDTLLPERRWL